MNNILDNLKNESETKVVEELNNKMKKAEGMLTGLILKEPSILSDYSINRKLLSEDGLFYIGITERLISKGIEVVDEVSFSDEVKNLDLTDKYNITGGYNTIRELSSIVDIRNADAIFDEWTKWHLVKKYNEKGILNITTHWDKLLKMKTSQIVDYIEYQINDIDITVASDMVFENLSFTNTDIQNFIDGINIGLQYNKHSPILNYLTMGIPLSEVYLFGGYVNSGKSSFVFENMILPLVRNGRKCCVISNEQKSIAFKVLLYISVLTEDLNYWKLTRKKIRTGKYTEEDLTMINKASEIIKTKYDPCLQFVKLFDYQSEKVNKIVKKLSNVGFECFMYDTFKVGEGDGQGWEKMITDSKALFQTASKHNVAMILTLQLALHTKNKVRYLDEGVLANGKQVSEIASEAVYMRDVWQDEMDVDSGNYIKPYKLKRDASGKFTNEKEEIKLDKDKKYKIMFLSKTRSDENGVTVLYEFNGNWNKWNEIGYCVVGTKNLY